MRLYVTEAVIIHILKVTLISVDICNDFYYQLLQGNL
jgi:hypothetical protein